MALLQYPTFGAAQNNAQRGGRLIQAVARPIAGSRPPLLPTAGRSAPTRAPYNPNKPPMGLGPDVVQQPQDIPTSQIAGSYVDPAVAQMAAIAARAAAIAGRTRQEAQAEADAKRKQATIEYGDATGVPGVDEATAAAAANNPFSLLASMQRGYNQGTQQLEEALNKANLFYSGYRGQQLGQAATDYQQNRYNAGTRFQGTINDINSALAQALLNADMMEMQAGGAGGGDGGGNGLPLVGRPGEWADLPVLVGWDPSRNSDAQYDMTNATPVPGGFIGPQGQRYDEKGRVV